MLDMIKTTEKTTKTEKASSQKNVFSLDVSEMQKAGLHFGHKTSKIHPKMGEYLSGIRNGVHIIDAEKTKEKLHEALTFIQDVISKGGKIVFVGTKIQAKELTKSTAEECKQPYIVNRWLGGTFTNLEVIKKRIDYFKDLENKKTTGELEKYTKKERLIFDKELKDLETKLGGIKEMNKLPEAIIVMDMIKDEIAIKEAKQKKVKIIAVADTNCDPTLVDFPIPANDDAMSSVKYILEKIKQAILSIKTND